MRDWALVIQAEQPFAVLSAWADFHALQGRYLVSEFKKAYPHAALTEIKMLDLGLWQ